VQIQLRRYFLGLVGFAFVISWASAGALTALLALTVCISIVAVPDLLSRQAAAPTRRRSSERTRAHLRARPLRDEAEHELPLVPDEPSLIFEAL